MLGLQLHESPVTNFFKFAAILTCNLVQLRTQFTQTKYCIDIVTYSVCTAKLITLPRARAIMAIYCDNSIPLCGDVVAKKDNR